MATTRFPLIINLEGPEVSEVQKQLEALGLQVPKVEAGSRRFGVGTRDAVLRFQSTHSLPPTGSVDAATAEALASAAAATMTGPKSRVEGRLILQDGSAGSGVTLTVHGVGPSGTARLGRVKTDERGYYSLEYETPASAPGLQIVATRQSGGEVTLTDVREGAGKHELMNLVAPRDVVETKAEHPRLVADLQRALGGQQGLDDIVEDEKRRDVSLLRRETGWDARLIGFAAEAERLSGEIEVEAKVLYTLFRVGLPTDPDRLATFTPTAVRRGLEKGRDSKISDLSDGEVKRAVTAFERFAEGRRLVSKVGPAHSSFGDLLDRSGLSDAGKRAFQKAYFGRADPSDDLWVAAEKHDVPPQDIRRLQVQGKLAYLTHQNATLTEALQRDFDDPERLEGLVDQGLYEKEAWQRRLLAVAGGDEEALASLIPQGFAGDTVEERLGSYAEDMARRVRIGFPTRVVAHKIGTDELSLGEQQTALKSEVQTVLLRLSERDYELGQGAFGAFVAEHRETLLGGIDEENRDAVLEQVARVQRLFQITPNDDALKVVLEHDLTSARDVVAFSKPEFVARFGDQLGSQTAELVYRKAEQVSSISYNLFTGVQNMLSSPGMFGVSGTGEAVEQVRQSVAQRYPTLESLFGTLDFCDCEHCESIFSPAAYLVDLLHFLEPEDRVWNARLTHWRAGHAGTPYPFKSAAQRDAFVERWRARHPGAADPAPERKPYEILASRRPDLAHIPLTCENTHTALPYIDVTNEILEHYVAHGRLDPGAAHDTGDADSADLLAEPRFTIAGAYDPLRHARYPIALPFDLWLERSRALFGHFDVDFAEVLEVFRRSDELEAPAVTPGSYGRAAVFTESLGISPGELTLLTVPDPLDQWFQLYGYEDEATALAELTSARTLANRLGIEYTELDASVRTRFVNPALAEATPLDRLEVEVQDVFRFKEHAAWIDEALPREDIEALEARLGSPDSEARQTLDALWDVGRLDEVLVLRAPPGGCDFEKTVAQHADGTAAEPYDLVRLHVFVRLRRRLGFTTLELDEVLTALLPGFSAAPLPPAGFGAALRTTLLYVAHLETIVRHLRLRQRPREHLLTLWTDLPTHGRGGLYAELFLHSGSAEAAAIFDDPVGDVPSRRDDPIADHVERLQGALGLGAREIDRILEAQGTDAATAKLSLANISLLHRHAVLARGLGLTILDLLKLIELTGLEPFRPLHGTPLDTIDDDHPFGQTVRFIEVARLVTDAGFSPDDLDYLLRHRFDPVGENAPDTREEVAFLTALAVELRRVRGEYSLPEDTASIDDERVWQRIALVLPNDLFETFRAMGDGSIEYRAAMPLGDPEHAIDVHEFADEQSVRLGVDEVRGEQWLVYTGVLTSDEQARLEALDESPLLAPLLADVHAQARSFFDTRLALTADSSAGFFDPADFEALFGSGVDTVAKRARLLEVFTPYLLSALSRREVVRALAARFEQDEALVERLVTDGGRLPAPDGGGALVESFLPLAEPGVTATYFEAGAELETRRVRHVDPTAAPANTDAVRYEGFLQVPATGAYRFRVRAEKAGTRVRLSLGEQPDPLIEAEAAADGEELGQHATLEVGVQIRFELTASGLGGGGVTVRVQDRSSGPVSLERMILHPRAAVESSRRSLSLLAKTLRVADRLELDGEELMHVLAEPDDFGRAGLAKLPGPDEPAPADATKLLETLESLVVYARLREEMAGGTPGLLEVLQGARRSRPAGADAVAEREALRADLHDRIAVLTRREASVVREVAEHLGFAATSRVDAGELHVEALDFARPRSLRRLWRAMQLVSRVGISPAAVIQAARPEPDAASADALRDAVRARFEETAWQRVAPEIFDPLRRKRRDALVAFLLHRMRLERVEQLYEHFLIDPGMEPVVQTSRIQLAIASVQLFIQRCLLNLEDEVDPSAINAGHWAWMKRYRVWEAARKLALYPENWLEPEFRDDKTHLFRQLESALLQADISEDTAEEALFAYLRGLDEIAHLEIVSLHAEEHLDPAATVLHVLGRTARLPHKYFHRQYQHRMWTPWSPVEVDIEGDHVALVMWRKRLQLFWVTFLDKGTAGTSAGSSVSNKKATNVTLAEIGSDALQRVSRKRIEVQLNWAEFAQGEWSTRESSGFDGAFTKEVDRDFDPGEVFIRVEREVAGDRERAVQVHLGAPISMAFRVVNRNAPARRRPTWAAVLPPFNGVLPHASKVQGPSSGELEAYFISKIERGVGDQPVATTADSILLGRTAGDDFSLVPCNNGPGFFDPATGGWSQELVTFLATVRGQPIPDHPTSLFWELLGELSAYFSAASARPFFYQNDHHVFYVEPTLRSRTVREWTDWGFDFYRRAREYELPEWWDELPVDPFNPRVDPIWPVDPRNPGWADPLPREVRFDVRPPRDWLANPVAAVRIKESLLGPAGGVFADPRSGGIGSGIALDERTLALIRSGSARGGAVILPAGERVAPLVVGDQGLNRAVLSRLTDSGSDLLGGLRGSLLRTRRGES